MPQSDQPGSETLLIQEAIAGNKESFGRLYELYARQIFSYLDMTETVFLRAWENLSNFGEKGRGMNFRAWLYRMAHNAMVDYHRTHKQGIDLEALAEQPDRLPHAIKLIESAEAQEFLVNKLEELDEVSRQVLVLRFYAEMNPKEISRIMGLSEGNVRVIQYRALKKMRDLIGDEDE